MASKVRGSKGFRRLLRNLPEAMRAELAKTMDAGGSELEAAIKARARRRTGRLIAGITKRMYPKTLKLRVGFLGTPRGRAKLFYAWILEFGRKGRIVSATRRKVGVNTGLRGGRKKSEDIAATYPLRITPLAPRRIVTGPLTDLRVVFGRRMRGIWDRALRSIAGVDGND